MKALVANYHMLCEVAAPARCAAVVKADAYGLGAIEVSRALAAAGCEQFFVSESFEGAVLREHLSEAEIFVLSGISEASARQCIEFDLTPVLGNETQVRVWRACAGARHPAAVKVDTGMTRLGFRWDKVQAQMFADLDVQLLMTHLACADTPAHVQNAEQLSRFSRISAAFPGVRTSIGNSAGTLNGTAFRGDLCRSGIGIYGGNPHAGDHTPANPVAYLEGQVLQVTTPAEGAYVGYGATAAVPPDSKLAVLGIGYANGLPRGLSNIGKVARGADIFPVIGRIAMNLTTVAVGNQVPIEIGEWVQVIGDRITLGEVARLTNTISYEILTGLKAPRVYC